MATAAGGGALGFDGADPRLSIVSHPELYAVEYKPGSAISFEEYMYWAAITRAEEKLANEEYQRLKGPTTLKSLFRDRFSKLTPTTNTKQISNSPTAVQSNMDNTVGEKGSASTAAAAPSPAHLDAHPEWQQASRAVRTAGWGSVFYLITTDILGPFQIPWSFAQMGYGPGFALYTVFGALAGYSGWILWQVFLCLDSDRYPMRNYADIFTRLFGAWTRQFLIIGQAIQLLILVGVIILLSGQSISQISMGADREKAGICFIVCLLVFMIAGCVVGQVRTLQRFSWLANFSVWLNLLIIFFAMGLVAYYPPNFAAVTATYGPDFQEGPILTFAGTPPSGFATGGSGFIGSLNGLNITALAYGGAILFVAFLAEMRNPMDFWKGVLCAQIFIYCAYLVFGMYVYHFHGQFTYNPIAQGISDYKWQTALNAMNLFTNLTAAGMYGNISMKIAYVELFERMLGFPSLNTRIGKIWWAVLIPVYWAVGFVTAAAIPQISLVSGLLGALFAVTFTYVFPGMAAIGFFIKRDAIIEEVERFNPRTRSYNYVDVGAKRLWRGFKKRPWLHLFNLIYVLGGLVTCVLGCYAAIVQLIAVFQNGVATSFSCKSPV